MQQVISATVAANATNKFKVYVNRPVTVVADGLSGAEQVEIRMILNNSPSTTVKTTLTVGDNAIEIRGEATYLIDKPVTASACSVHISSSAERVFV